jgi:SAM-dependent methyltransferase
MPALAQADIERIRQPEEQSDEIAKLFSIQLGWGGLARDLGRTGREERVVELSSGGETQLLLLLSAQASSTRAASLAYTREARYSGNWTPDGLSVSQVTHWGVVPGDSLLFDAPAEGAALRGVLEQLERDTVLDGVADQRDAGAVAYPPLAGKLASELARLRAEIAQSGALAGESPNHRDLAVLRFFHQLLYLRIAEDRGLAASEDGVRRLLDVADPIAATADLLSRSTERLNSELFAGPGIPIDEMGAESLSKLIAAMTEPWNRLRLDFQVAHTELASRLYESYLGLVPSIEASEAELQIFPTIRPRDLRSLQASYYTPAALADAVVDRVLTAWTNAMAPTSFAEVRVLDPACGSGTFLCAAYRWLRTFFELRRGRSLSERERRELLTASIFGSDLDERSLGLARVQLLELAELKGQLPSMAENLIAGDALPAPPGTEPKPDAVNWQQLIDRVGAPTCIVTNPPFISEANRRDILGDDRVTALDRLYADVRSKGADHAYTFVSLAKRLLSKGGAFGAILPRQVLTAEAGLKARSLLFELGIEWIVDFRTVPLFTDVDVGTCAVAGIQRQTKRTWTATLQTVSSFEKDPRRVVDALTVSTGLEGCLCAHGYNATVLKRRIEDGWAPLKLRRMTLRNPLMRGEGGCLGEHATVTQGVKPAGPTRFEAARVEELTGGRVKLGDAVLPVEFLPYLISGSQVLPFMIEVTGERVLLPFDEDRHLTDEPAVTAILREIGGLPTNYRAGNLHVLRRPKLLIRTVAFEPATAVDLKGDLVPKVRAAHAVGFDDVDDHDLLGLAALLNSAPYQWLLRNAGTPRQGQFVELSDRDIRELPWPELQRAELDGLNALAKEATEALALEDEHERAMGFRGVRRTIDALSYELLRVSAKTRQLIADELRRSA